MISRQKKFPVDDPGKIPYYIRDYFNNNKSKKKRKEKLLSELPLFYPFPIKKSHTGKRPLLKDAAGNFWISSETGLIFIEKNRKPFHTIRNEIHKPKLINHNNIHTIHEINDNEVLLGFSAGGFNHLELNTLKILKNLSNSPNCWATAKGKGNTYWFGGGGGLYDPNWIGNYNPQTGDFFLF